MWARNIEMMLGLFLMIQGFFFHQISTFYWFWHLCISAFLIIFSLLSYYKRMRHIHLLSLLATCCLAIGGYMDLFHSYPVSQSDFFISLILLMINPIPSFAENPPKRWTNFRKDQSC